MTPRPALGAVLGLLALTGGAPAQTADQPSVVLSIFGGVQTGYGLWTLPRQPLCVTDGAGQCTSDVDTLRLVRQAGSSLVAGVTAIYFPRPHIGLHAQLAYQGFPLDDTCTGVAPFIADPEQRNEQVCNSITRTGVPGGSMSALVGVVLRAAPRGALQPFLRVGAGIVSRPQSSIQLVGDYRIGNTVTQRVVLRDASPRRTWLSLLISAGIAVPLAPGYQFRLELRDLAGGIERPAGPATPAGVVETGTTLTNSFALTLGLDIVLERRRGRRY